MKTFKAFVAVVLAALTLSLTGCKKDNEDLIIGKWDVTASTITYTMQGETETEDILADGTQATMTFQKDGTMISWTKDADGEEFTESGKWSIKDDKVTFEFEESETQMMPVMTFNIDKLDKKNMELTYNGNIMGTNIELKMSFKKA